MLHIQRQVKQQRAGLLTFSCNVNGNVLFQLQEVSVDSFALEIQITHIFKIERKDATTKSFLANEIVDFSPYTSRFEILLQKFELSERLKINLLLFDSFPEFSESNAFSIFESAKYHLHLLV